MPVKTQPLCIIRPTIRPSLRGGASGLLYGEVAYWKMEEATGSRIDVGGLYDLTDNNGVLNAAGKDGQGADFSPAVPQQYLSVGGAAIRAIFESGGVFTITGWHATNNNTNANKIAAFGSASLDGFYFHMKSAQVRAACYDGTSETVTDNPGMTNGVWYFFATGYDGTNVWVAVGTDARATTASSGVGADPDGQFILGTQASIAGNCDGVIDHVRLFNSDISEATRTALANEFA